MLIQCKDTDVPLKLHAHLCLNCNWVSLCYVKTRALINTFSHASFNPSVLNSHANTLIGDD